MIFLFRDMLFLRVIHDKRLVRQVREKPLWRAATTREGCGHKVRIRPERVKRAAERTGAARNTSRRLASGGRALRRRLTRERSKAHDGHENSHKTICARAAGSRREAERGIPRADCEATAAGRAQGRGRPRGTWISRRSPAASANSLPDNPLTQITPRERIIFRGFFAN